MVISQNALLPIIGGIITIGTTYIFQYSMSYLSDNFDSLVLLFNKPRWIYYLPRTFQILSKGYVWQFILTFLIYISIIIIATIPQILYVKNRSIIEDITKNNF